MIYHNAANRPCFEASGVTIRNWYRRHRHQKVLRFLSEVDANLPRGPEVHLVIDNYGTHKVSKVHVVSAIPAIMSISRPRAEVG